MRKYGLFYKNGKRWIRYTENGVELPAYGKQSAIRIYQNRLLAGAFGGIIVDDKAVTLELRPVPETAEEKAARLAEKAARPTRKDKVAAYAEHGMKRYGSYYE